MSEDNEKKSEEIGFDINSFAGEGTPPNDAQDGIAGITPETDESADLANLESGVSLEKNAETPAADNPSESVEDVFAGLGNFPLAENTEEPLDAAPEEPVPDTAGNDLNLPPVVSDEKEDKKSKKPKKEKPKKEKTKREKKPAGDKTPLGLDGILALVLIVVLLGALIAYTVFTVMNPSKDVGFTSTIYYLVGVWIFGLFGIFVPIGFFTSREKSGKEPAPEDKLEVFKVALGVSTMAVSIGAILLLSEFYHYDFEIKPSSPVPSVSMPSAEPNLNP